MVAISYSSCSVSNWFLNSSWNSIFFGPIGVIFTLTLILASCHQFFLSTSTFQFEVPNNYSMVTPNVDLADDCYVCNDVWPVCYDVVSFGLRYTVWALRCLFSSETWYS